MKRNFYTTKKKVFLLLTASVVLLNLMPAQTQAQSFCNNEFVYWNEDFGTGTTFTSDPHVVNLTYDPNGVLAIEGIYRVANNTFQLDDWHNSPDHTPADVNGKMLVVNGEAGDFYVNTINRPQGFPAGFYSASLSLMNVNTVGQCSPNPLLPVITFKVEYQDENGNWVKLTNSPVTTSGVPQTATPTWVQLGGVFVLPTTGLFSVTNIRLTLADETIGGCGNDFALDDIKLASCPDGGPTPVEFLNISAQQKGSGVAINWATASEMNNKYFDVEKSTDGGLSWTVVASVPGKGNSSSTRTYAAYDAKPVAGMNYYRIRQVDFDGASKYSATATFNLKITQTTASVLANPFKNNITVDFLSTRNQPVNIRLFDLSGRQLIAKQLNIAKGSSRIIMDEVNSLNRAIYLLRITDENGAILYNDKLIKQ